MISIRTDSGTVVYRPLHLFRVKHLVEVLSSFAFFEEAITAVIHDSTATQKMLAIGLGKARGASLA